MPDWLMSYLARLQGSIVRNLAIELRSGGVDALALAFSLGALRALGAFGLAPVRKCSFPFKSRTARSCIGDFRSNTARCI